MIKTLILASMTIAIAQAPRSRAEISAPVKSDAVTNYENFGIQVDTDQAGQLSFVQAKIDDSNTSKSDRDQLEEWKTLLNKYFQRDRALRARVKRNLEAR